MANSLEIEDYCYHDIVNHEPLYHHFATLYCTVRIIQLKLKIHSA